MASAARPARDPFRGAIQIVRFNWPWYVLAVAVGTSGAVLLRNGTLDRSLAVPLFIAVGLAGFWLVVSLAVSHAVYDRSEVATGAWMARVLPIEPRVIANFHAGLDETSPLLSARFPAARVSVFCFHDSKAMGEASIERARRSSDAETGSVPIHFSAIPVKDGVLDAAFVVFSAHELRQAEDRLAFFAGLRRILRPAGDLVVVEHLRDAWNFAAFGPGSRHFLSPGAWRRSFGGSGFTVRQKFRITPFVTVFRLRVGPTAAA